MATLFESMTATKSLDLTLWTTKDHSGTLRHSNAQDDTFNLSVFATLARLPHLRTIRLTVPFGTLEYQPCLTLIQEAAALQTLSISVDVGEGRVWTQEQLRLVKEAAEAAGVEVSYTVE